MTAARQFPCCPCCRDDDPVWHEDNPRDSHETSCPTCDAAKSPAEVEVRRLREGIEALAEWWQRAPDDDGYSVACRDHAQHVLALLNPSGASDD